MTHQENQPTNFTAVSVGAFAVIGMSIGTALIANEAGREAIADSHVTTLDATKPQPGNTVTFTPEQSAQINKAAVLGRYGRAGFADQIDSIGISLEECLEYAACTYNPNGSRFAGKIVLGKSIRYTDNYSAGQERTTQPTADNGVNRVRVDYSASKNSTYAITTESKADHFGNDGVATSAEILDYYDDAMTKLVSIHREAPGCSWDVASQDGLLTYTYAGPKCDSADAYSDLITGLSKRFDS